MTDLFAARFQMGISLGFHIVFAAVGIAMPFLMCVAHGMWLRTGDEVYLKLTKAWSKGVAIFFATGAVSGTVLSFELGLLWPKFMEHAGPIIGMPFSWEGTAFFIEAIALGIFLYGWGRIPNLIHWLSGLCVGLSGLISGLVVVSANAWMNTPRGFDWVNGEAVNIDPWAAMFNPASFVQGIHMSIAAFAATGFAVSGIHAIGLLKNPQSLFHKKALKIALVVGSVAAILQPIQGDRLAKSVGLRQPEKLAAMESLFRTEKPASLLIGGIPSQKEENVKFGLHIPGFLSFLANGDFKSEVKGLEAFPKDTWPPVAPVHFSFQIMVAIGSLLALVGILSLIFIFKSTLFERRKFLKLLVICTPLGFLALECGWIVTEVGRQPWIIYGIMRTKDALTPMPGLVYTMVLVTSLYLFLIFVVTWLMIRQFKNVS
jgi:cytochrome d ubiquinol oxidase subunit I